MTLIEGATLMITTDHPRHRVSHRTEAREFRFGVRREHVRQIDSIRIVATTPIDGGVHLADLEQEVHWVLVRQRLRERPADRADLIEDLLTARRKIC
jgi:hypothetical protein